MDLFRWDGSSGRAGGRVGRFFFRVLHRVYDSPGYTFYPAALRAQGQVVAAGDDMVVLDGNTGDLIRIFPEARVRVTLPAPEPVASTLQVAYRAGFATDSSRTASLRGLFGVGPWPIRNTVGWRWLLWSGLMQGGAERFFVRRPHRARKAQQAGPCIEVDAPPRSGPPAGWCRYPPDSAQRYRPESNQALNPLGVCSQGPDRVATGRHEGAAPLPAR